MEKLFGMIDVSHSNKNQDLSKGVKLGWFFMNDKEKLRMAKNLVKSNNKKIKTALKLIEHMEQIIEKERVEFLKEDKSDNVDSLAKTFFKLEKSLLEQIKETLS